MTTQVKAAASSTTISLGVVSTTVDVVPARRSDGEVSFKLLCPQCPTETRGKQVYICNHDESHQYTSAEADRAIEVDKALRRVSEEEIASIKATDLPPGEISLTVVPAAEVEAKSLPSGALYRLRPRADNDKAYALIASFVADRAYAFIGEMTVRGNQRMYRCSLWNGMVVLQEMVRPSEFHEAEPVNLETDPRLAEVGKTLIKTLVEPFDPELFANRTRDRATALAEAKRTGTPVPAAAPAPKAPDSNDALLAILEASVKTAKKSKGKK